MKNIFSVKTNARVRPNDILVKAHKSATFSYLRNILQHCLNQYVTFTNLAVKKKHYQIPQNNQRVL